MISLDFELHWGVRDKTPVDGGYRENLLGVWAAVPELLRLFHEYEIAATWATVGFLFAESREQLLRFSPVIRPQYAEARFDPYSETVGEGEETDLLHFAPSLIDRIRATRRQEIGTHTFSHYYCLEKGQTKEAFRADLSAAVSIAATRSVRPRSIVFPRNQHNPAYDDVLRELDVPVYRGNQQGWMYRPVDETGNSASMRAGRILNAYFGVTGAESTEWSAISQPNGLYNIPANFFLRAYTPRMRAFEPLRLRRIVRSMRHAAQRGRVVHIWWHPHNFGRWLDENLSFLSSVLDAYAQFRERYGMRSLSMIEAAEAVSHEAGRYRAGG